MQESMKIVSVSGRPVAVPGDDIDTDRIIPARYLRCISFDGLGEHAFEDDRAQLREKGVTHPLDDPRFRGAGVLLVNRNFGCGSSREHAPRALQLRGIRVVVGESFAEIFFGNCVAMGLPCVTVSRESIEKLVAHAGSHPDQEVTVDLEALRVRTATFEVECCLPKGPREAFLNGTWDATGFLLERYEEVESVAGRLPYLRGFAGS